MEILSIAMWVTALIVTAWGAACPAFTCGKLDAGKCGVLMSKTLVTLNTDPCPTGTACKLAGTQSYMGMLDLIPFFPLPFDCPAEVPTTPTAYTPQDCKTKVPNKNWKNGGTTLLCTTAADCVMQDDTTALCVCSPRSDGKALCQPHYSNTDVFGDYWALCEANGNKIPTVEAYNYFSIALDFIAIKDADLPCAMIFQEAYQLPKLKTIYLCAAKDPACPCTGATFLNTATVVCDSCDPNCATCSSSGATSCNSCPTGSSLSGTAPNSCVCLAGTFPDPAANHCSACDASCSTCSGAGASKCTGCKTNARLNGDGTCTCPVLNGYYGGATDCKPCDPSCNSCDGPTSNDCRNPCGVTLPNGDCESCLESYYLAAPKCMACDKSCKGCNDAGANKCTSCHTGATLDTGVCSCNPGLFLDLVAMQCAACDASCVTCSAASASSCLSCKTHATISSGTCVCDSGFFWKADTNICDTCATTCATCSGSATSCKSCKSGATLSGTTCSCISGSPNPESCVLCDSSCAGCSYTAPTVCTACSASMFLVGGLCRGCPDTCTTCAGTDCSGCYPNAGLTTTTPKRCVCGTGYFPNPTVVSCSACDISCKTCSASGSSACLSCYSPAVISGTNCVCPSGTYPNPGANLCASCDVTCLACSAGESNKCTSCKTGATLISGICNCNAGSFPNPDASQCTTCNLACKTCSGAGIDMCLTCDANAQLSGGTAPGTCVCAAGLTGTPATGCLVCHNTCQTCKDATATMCNSCKLGAILKGAMPSACICTSGYLSQPDASNCSPCDITCDPSSGLPPCVENCSLCSGNQCQKCMGSMSLQPEGGVCKAGCPDAYYSNAGTCTVCSEPCITCSSPTACLSCDSEHVLKGTSCVRDCQPSYFSIDDSMCMPCDSTCLSCDGPLSTSCLICKNGYFLKDGLCVECSSCATCNSSGYCLTCATGFNLTTSGTCESCVDCNKPITVTLGNPKPNVFSITFSRGVSHFFLAVDFVISTDPPAIGLLWTVENNPDIGKRRRMDTGTSLVYINIIAGEWDSNAVFGVAFTNSSMITDVYGEPLPSIMSFTSTPPLGPEASDSDGGDDGPSDGTIIGAVVGSFLGACVIVLVFLVIYKWRKSLRTTTVKSKYEEVGADPASLQISH